MSSIIAKSLQRTVVSIAQLVLRRPMAQRAVALERFRLLPALREPGRGRQSQQYQHSQNCAANLRRSRGLAVVTPRLVASYRHQKAVAWLPLHRGESPASENDGGHKRALNVHLHDSNLASLSKQRQALEVSIIDLDQSTSLA